MANLSDAFGTITVKRVGREFLEYLEIAQKDAYYVLCDENDLYENRKENKLIEPDEEGNLQFSFSTFGRWAYSNNLNGYLKGEWANWSEGSKEKKAFNNLMKALKEKKGRIRVEYKDSDTAMDWMGSGTYIVWVKGGKIDYVDLFAERPITLDAFIDLYKYTEDEALDYLYGDDVAEAYKEYRRKESHPEEVEIWYDEIFEGV